MFFFSFMDCTNLPVTCFLLCVFQVWNERAAKNAQKWAKKCEMEISPTDQRVIDGT